MKKASLITGYYLRNKIFNITDPIANRDNCLYRYYLLRENFRRLGVDLSTHDINHCEDSDVVIALDCVDERTLRGAKVSPYLILFESHVIKPQNWICGAHDAFRAIFTWNDQLVDGSRYIKTNFAHKWPEKKSWRHERSKLCTMIAANKMVEHPNELYSERIRAIRWFEKHHPEDFDLYGVGWDEFCSRNKPAQRIVRKLPPLSRLLRERYPSYAGSVRDKKEVLRHYRFALAYENAIDIPGYVTEKIFDCFFAGVVPVYLGAPNITEHIPRDTFIDMREFRSYADLYRYMSKMADGEYEAYLRAIARFIDGESAMQFRAEHFSRTVVDTILGRSAIDERLQLTP